MEDDNETQGLTKLLTVVFAVAYIGVWIMMYAHYPKVRVETRALLARISHAIDAYAK